MKRSIKFVFVAVFIFAISVLHARSFTSIKSLSKRVKRMRGQTISMRLTPVSRRSRSITFKDNSGGKLVVVVKTGSLRRKLRRITLNRTVVFQMRIRKTLAVNRTIGANYGMRGHTRIKMIVSTIDWE